MRVRSVHKAGYGHSPIERRRHRSWPETLKREIVAASFAPGNSVAVVARQYNVNANQVFSWRKRYRAAPLAPSDPPAPRLMPVVITGEPDGVAEAPSAVAEKIEIEVAGKYCVRIGSGFDRQALRRVLDVLERR